MNETCSQNKLKIKTEYFNFGKELGDKTNEVEKLKIKIKDLKEILNLKDKLKDTGLKEKMKR